MILWSRCEPSLSLEQGGFLRNLASIRIRFRTDGPNRRTDCTARETQWRISIAPRQRLAQFEFLLNFLNLNLCSLHLALGLRTCRSKAFFAPPIALHFCGI